MNRHIMINGKEMIHCIVCGNLAIIVHARRCSINWLEKLVY